MNDVLSSSCTYSVQLTVIQEKSVTLHQLWEDPSQDCIDGSDKRVGRSGS